MPERLALIHRKLVEVIAEWTPQAAAVEEVFMSRNASSALKLGQARGVAIAACVVNHVSIDEYAARTVKQAIVGSGAAAKEQVQHMTKALLNIHGRIQADAADALAIAICHGHSRLPEYNNGLTTIRRRSRSRRLRA